ncbi:MAG: F0F1 ATP synthase subunit delta [Candidatus Harrisonbacteria bacterium]|nr:F0F1 ATP synthase subunit delta [Candidatus Harrisonbacteria bacterium]MBI2604381.1 F0F1 ATP synthase subunit delta [Candidatus Harrisonbacteria bacterium]
MPIIQHKARVYAQLLVDALRKAKGAAVAARVANFKKLLKRTGDLKIAGKVVKEFERLWARREGEVALAVVARPLHDAARKKLAATLKANGYVLQEKIDPNVLGGVQLRLGEELLVDGTIMNKLQRLRE